MLAIKRLKFKYYRVIIVAVLLFLLFNAFLSVSLSDWNSLTSEPAEEVIRTHDDSKVDGTRRAPERSINTTLFAEKGIHEFLFKIDSLNAYYEPSYIKYLDSLVPAKIRSAENVNIWRIAANWANVEQIIPNVSPLVPSVLENLRTSKIVTADVARKGTQLKILLELENGQTALFKPKWYSVDKVIEGTVYAGKDRYNGEIVAFHLARLLSLNRVPLVTYRRLNLALEIIPFATPSLNKTFLKRDKNICFYGECFHCTKEDPVCADGALLDGAITLWLPESLGKPVKKRHPWQRTYNSRHAQWETDPDYCNKIMRRMDSTFESILLDLVETSVFDFLIDNGDRHHFEMYAAPKGKVLLIDNGKSFGNPNMDHIDILAPLYQCCKIRLNFVRILVTLKKDSLSRWLKKVLNKLNLDHLLAVTHFMALDRRLNKVLATIMMCLSQHSVPNVLVHT